MQYGARYGNYNFGSPGSQHYSYGIFSQPGGFGPAFPSTYSTGWQPSYGPLYGQPQLFSGYNGGIGGGYTQGQLDGYYGYNSALSQNANPYIGRGFTTTFGGNSSWNNSVFDDE